MPSFDSTNLGNRYTFGKNEYRRSTVGLKYESYTVAASTVTAEDFGGEAASQKVLQPGEVLAKITSGPDAGKVGPYQNDVGVTDGRQTAANIVGVNDTFLPWQLNERDVEVAVCYDGALVQAWCFERNASGARVALTNATRDAIVGNAPTRMLRFS